MVACTVTGAAVKKNGAAASTLRLRATDCNSVICTSTSNVRLILPRLGHFEYEKQLARTIRVLTAVSFFLSFSRTYSYEPNLCFFSCENSFGILVEYIPTYIAVIASFEQCKLLSESSSALFLNPSLCLLAVSLRRSMGYVPCTNGYPKPVPFWSLALFPYLRHKRPPSHWTCRLYYSKMAPNILSITPLLCRRRYYRGCSYVHMSYSQGSCIGQYLCKLVKSKTPLI